MSHKNVRISEDTQHDGGAENLSRSFIGRRNWRLLVVQDLRRKGQIIPDDKFRSINFNGQICVTMASKTFL